MKRLIKYISVILLLLIVAVFAAPFFIPIDSVKKIASEKVKEVTGRELTIGGNIKASIWPNIGITIEKAALSNPEGFSTKQMAEIGELNVGVALMPLLSGQVQVNEFVITKPVINLEVNKNNVANWDFAKNKNEDNNTATDNNKSPTSLPSIGKITIKDGEFTYNDAHAGKFYNAKDVNIELKMPSSSSPLEANINMEVNKEKLTIALHANNALAFLSGTESPLKSNIKIGSMLTLEFSGKASTKSATGTINLNIPSLVALSGWSGKKMDWKGETKLSFAAEGGLACTTSQCEFSKTKLQFDDNNLSGDAKIIFSGAVPAIEATLTTSSLNVNPYLPKESKQSGIQLISDAVAAEGWDSKPIDMSALRSANAKINMKIGTLIYQKASFNNIALALKLASGVLNLDIPKAELYSGTAKLSATASAINAISANFTAENIQLEPMLKDFADFDRLSGTAKFSASINGKATSQRELMSSLGGNGNIQISDGSIRGVNIAQIVANARSVVTGVDKTSERTNFSELGGSYTITQGIVKNTDLAMKAPLLRLTGSGTVDLPNRYVNYRLLPTLVATMQGQGGKDKSGIEIPILVTGNFEQLKFTPDVASIAQEAIKNPEKIKETVKSIKENIKKPDDIKNLLKGFR